MKNVCDSFCNTANDIHELDVGVFSFIIIFNQNEHLDA